MWGEPQDDTTNADAQPRPPTHWQEPARGDRALRISRGVAAFALVMVVAAIVAFGAWVVIGWGSYDSGTGELKEAVRGTELARQVLLVGFGIGLVAAVVAAWKSR